MLFFNAKINLVRLHFAANGEYRLSKLELGDSGEWEVMHYKIERNSSGNYFIDSSQTFPTILSLVDYYKGNIHSNGIL